MIRVDAHIHYMGDTPDMLGLLEQLDLKMLNICVAEDAHGRWRSQAEAYRRLAQEHPGRFAWCTSFDLPRLEDPQYVDKAIEELEQDFAQGAIACKVWKNIGMEARKPSGEYMMVDDPLLEPIFSFVADRNKTLLMHIADPLDCWRPLYESSPHYSYYSEHPEWHLHGREDMPSHQQLMDARDAVVARHSNLRIVGAHLGSLEHDVAEVANRFERYPNFAVDMSARLLDLALQDTAKMRAFFLKYQDRILFGTDVGTWGLASLMSAEKREHLYNGFINSYQEHFRYLEKEGPMTISDREVMGIGLPAEVLEKIYRSNARRWYPGL
ncbi:MAG TPA: amidohydrolase family protein [Chthonomonadaceae bacterium]|nr:amidohydrolase family protein [Chthonomonadaceae bacterium]